MHGPVASYQQLANEYDDMICKKGYWDRVWDENYPNHEQMQEYQRRSSLSINELDELFDEWFHKLSSFNKYECNEVKETWKQEFNTMFD